MKLKPWVKISLFLIIIILSIFFIKKLYNKPEISQNNDINQTIEYLKKNNIYNDKYQDEYLKITYLDQDYFKNYVNVFLDKGYKGEEINYIMSLSLTNIEKLVNKDYVNIENYYQYKNFNVDNIERYMAYYENNDYSYQDVITYVNLNLDLPVYTNTLEANDPNNYLVLVNKYNSLPNNYKPSDLEYLKGAYGNNVPMRKVAKEALVKLQQAAKEEINIELLPTTAFRDQAFQKTLYNNYVASDGVSKADTYSARPGFSEHQTGLAIDLKNPARSNVRLSESDYNWLKNNAYRFGFIIRFPKDKEFITGYQEENWHIRYVGLNEAKLIYDNNLTLEEYVDLYLKEY